jgi:hypothetical protein
MFGRQPQAGVRHQVDFRVVHRRHGVMHGTNHRLILLRSGDGQHLRVGCANGVGLVAHAAGDDHPAVLVDGFTDGRQRLGLGGIEKAAGVHDDGVRAFIVGRKHITFRTKLGEDAL